MSAAHGRACGWPVSSAVQATELQWWSHWAIEDNKKIVLFEAKRRFEAKNPGHTVTITFYEKKNMFTTLRAAFTAGSGFPDVVYYDIDAPEFMQAGWLADLSTGVRWENIEPYGKAFWTRPGPGGKIGVWALPLEAASDELYYNAQDLQAARRHGAAERLLHPGAVQGPRGQVRQGRLRGVRHRRRRPRLGRALHAQRACCSTSSAARTRCGSSRARSPGRTRAWSRCSTTTRS